MRALPVHLSPPGRRAPGPLLGPAEVRALAARLGLRPRKSLGQNFVVDPNTVRRVVRRSGVGPDDVVLEVGPGLGSLTLALLGAARAVVAVEVDPVLAAALPATVAEHRPDRVAGLTVLAADATSVAGEVGGLVSHVVANLPYNVAVPVLLHVMREFEGVRAGLVMVQSEVADRLVAPPGSRVYGVPSVKLAWFAEARRAGPVPRAVFWPVPNVDSALVALTRRPPPATAATREQVFALVDAAFRSRRKSLRAGLAGWAGGPDPAEELLRAAGIDPGARAETLDVAQFARLAGLRAAGTS